MIATLYYRHRPLAKLRIILRHDKNLLNQRVCADNPLDFLRLNAFSATKKDYPFFQGWSACRCQAGPDRGWQTSHRRW